MATNSNLPIRRVLHSWKEISSYTGRGVRTIQRYEVQFGFPVHRPAGSPRSAVLAFTDEIDRWLAGSPKRSDEAVNGRALMQGDQTVCIHAVYAKAKLGRERALSMQQRLLATKALLDRLNESMLRGRARRDELVTKPQVAKKIAPARATA